MAAAWASVVVVIRDVVCGGRLLQERETVTVEAVCGEPLPAEMKLWCKRRTPRSLPERAAEPDPVGRPIGTVFDLLGDEENDLTYSVG